MQNVHLQKIINYFMKETWYSKLSCANIHAFIDLSAGVLAFLALPVGLVSSAQELYLSQTSQDSVAMAAAHSSPISPPKPAPLEWHQEGSSSGEWSSKGTQLSDIILPTVALPLFALPQTTTPAPPPTPARDRNAVTPNTVSADSHVSQPQVPSSDTVNQGLIRESVRVPQVHSPVNVSNPKTNTNAESAVKNAPISLVVASNSSSDRGKPLDAHHKNPQSVEEPHDPRQPHVSELQPSSLSVPAFSSVNTNAARDLKLREHVLGSPELLMHHTITLREVHVEPPTSQLELHSTGGPATLVDPQENSTFISATTAQSTEAKPKLFPTVFPVTHTPATSEEGHIVQGNGTDGPPVGHQLGNATAPAGLFSNNSAVEEAPAQGNSSEPPSTPSRNVLNRQVPATTNDSLTPGNSSGPTVEPPPSRTMICLSRMDFVWIVLAISVPVSSCCK